MKKLEGYRTYPGVGTIHDEDVYQFIRQHSRLIDRLNPRKMLEMTEWAYAELSGDAVHAKGAPVNWKYYGRNKR